MLSALKRIFVIHRLKSHAFIVTAFVALAAINFVVFITLHSNSDVHTHSKNKILGAGEHLPLLSGKDMKGNTITVSANKPNLVLYLSSSVRKSNYIELIKYAEDLYTQHKNEGLRVTGIISGDDSEHKSLYNSSLITYDLLEDHDFSLGRKLRMLKGTNGVFYFDKKGVCTVSSNHFVTSEDLRQIVMQEFLHKNAFDRLDLGDQLILEARSLPSVNITKVDTLRRMTLGAALGNSPRFIIFITAACSVCSLPSVMGQIQDYIKTHHNNVNVYDAKFNRKGDVILVFDFNFSSDDVVGALKSVNLPVEAYIADKKLTTVANTIERKLLNNDQLLAVMTSKDGTVRRVTALNTVINNAMNNKEAESTDKAGQGSVNEARYTELFTTHHLNIYDVAGYKNKYFVSDLRGNRVVYFDNNLNPEREVGGIGNVPGRMIHPGDIGVSAKGTVYVYDIGNRRIQLFDDAGNVIGNFDIAPFEGFAVSPPGDLYVGQAENGRLVTVYSQSGKMLRSFGHLKTLSDIYGDKFISKNDQYKFAINRVRIFIDNEGYVYLTFMLAPILQKYRADGSLVFERKLEGPEINKMAGVVLSNSPEKYMSRVLDGIDERIILLDPVVDPFTGDIYILLADRSVYIVNRDGEKPRWVRSPTDDVRLYPFMSGIGGNGEILSVSVSRRCFRLTIPITASATGATIAPSVSQLAGTNLIRKEVKQ